jgi:hypothetical protein
MATGELALGSDGELVLKAGLWAIGKLYYIRRYCDIFNAAMKDKWPTRVYIDLFAAHHTIWTIVTRKVRLKFRTE